MQESTRNKILLIVLKASLAILVTGLVAYMDYKAEQKRKGYDA